MKSKIIFWAYIVIGILNISGHVFDFQELIRFTKPLLIPVLILFVYESSRGKVTFRILLLVLALIFSWLGDVSLLYGSTELYFLIGLGLFLVAQVVYIITLRRSSYQNPIRLLRIAPFAVYLAVLLLVLIPKAGSLWLPIVVYGVVICFMAISANTRQGFTSSDSYKLAFIGSILFVISDTLLAIDKFHTALPVSGLWVMSTYIAAQLLLTLGILKHVE